MTKPKITVGKLIETTRPRIKLKESDHTYSIQSGKEKGRIADTSVTTLIGLMNDPFDADKILDKKAERDSQFQNPVVRARLKLEWATSGAKGTYYHYLMEMFLLGKLHSTHFDALGEKVEPRVLPVIKYMMSLDWDEWEVLPEYETYYRTKSGKIIGNTIDVLLRSKNDPHKYMVKDFKFTKPVNDTSYGKKMKMPIGFVPASKIHKYSMQLTVNMMSIKQEDPKATFVGGGDILNCTPDNQFQCIPAIDVKDAVEMMIDYYDVNDVK